LQGTIDTLERQLQQSGRAAVANCVHEIDTRATHITHATFESLYKAAGWYERKIQTLMRATLERGLEQARAGLHEKAREASGLLRPEVERLSSEFRTALAQIVEQGLARAQQDLVSDVEALKANLRSEIQAQKDWARQALDHLRQLLSPDATAASPAEPAGREAPRI
jgi:hypothetical protein